MVHRSIQSSIRRLLLHLALPGLLLTVAFSQTQQLPPQQTDAPPSLTGRQPPAPRPSPPSASTNNQFSDTPTSRQPSTKGGHPAETNPGHTPHDSGNGGTAAAAAIGSIAAAAIIGELIAHNKASPEHFGHNGPEVPRQFDMSAFSVKGLIGPNWPVVLDFLLYSPGSVQVEILTTDKRRFRATLTNQPNHRAYGIFRLPKDFGSKIQTAVFQVSAIPAADAGTIPAGTAAPAPALRTFGMGAGENAVGSVAIDQLTFQPAAIHPKAKEFATYGFHAHSAFNGVRAEFIYVTMQNGHVIVEQDQEEKLSPIPQGERARGTWEGKGKAGEHMLQVRAWRGLENGGDWVVAWSPEIVDVVK